jgi:predicted Zn-dependent protease
MTAPRQYGLSCLCLLFPPFPGGAAEPGIDHKQQYRAYITLSCREPWQAFEAAETWAGVGGGPAAHHCAAMALPEAKQYDRAAQRLETLAASLAADHFPTPDNVWAQAANVRFLGGWAKSALRAIERALRDNPDAAGYLVDRGCNRVKLAINPPH